MIKHIVMWRLLPEALGATATQNARRLKTMLEGLRETVAVIRHLEVGIEVFAAQPACDVILYSEFDSREDLEAYQAHPEHQRCVGFVRQVTTERRLVDYAIGAAESDRTP